jgi:hypothetical protein
MKTALTSSASECTRKKSGRIVIRVEQLCGESSGNVALRNGKIAWVFASRNNV